MNALKEMPLSLDHGMAEAGGPSHSETGTPAGETRRRITPLDTLDGFTEELSACKGVNLSDLEPMTKLAVRTSHSVYRIIVLPDTTVLVQGGHFPGARIGHLHGSGFGGSLLKLGWIGVGLRMEISVDGKRFVTSVVRAITTENDPATDRPQ
jgi:hypothetical protein